MRFYLLFCLFIVSLSFDALAQDFRGVGITGKNEKAFLRDNQRFEDLVERAQISLAPNMSFSAFRSGYVNTSQYVPVADGIIDEMIKISYRAETAEDPRIANKEFARFRLLVKDHMGNIKVVLQALSMARRDDRYGDVAFLEYIRTGLVQNLLQSGSGHSLDEAYDVITMEEQILLFQALGFEILETKPREEGYLFYTIYEVEDKKTGERRAVFVNTTYPMKRLRRLSEEHIKGPGTFLQ